MMRQLPAQPSASPHAGIGFVQFVVVMAALQALGALGVDSMLPNLPVIGQALGVADENRRQLIITVYMLGFGLPQIVYGPLADRYGRKPVLVAGLVLYIGFSLGAALSRSFEGLLIARLFQGIGAAAVRVVPVSIIRDRYSGRQMARVLSLISIVFMGVPILAPSLGQALLRLGPWPLIFAVLAVLGLVVLAWTLLRLPETLHPQDRLPIQAVRIASAFRTAATNRTSAGYALAQTFLFGGLIGFITSAEQVFADAFHAAGSFAFVFALAASFIAIAALLNSRLVVKVGTRRLSHGGLLAFVALAAAQLAIIWAGRETLVVFAAFQAASMFAFGLTSGNFNAMAMEPMGHIAGVAAALQGTVSTVGAALIGFFIGQQFSGSAASVVEGYLVCGLLSLVAVLVAERGRLFRPQMGG